MRSGWLGDALPSRSSAAVPFPAQLNLKAKNRSGLAERPFTLIHVSPIFNLWTPNYMYFIDLLLVAKPKAVGYAKRCDGEGSQGFDIIRPLGDLRAQVALDLESDGIGLAGDIGAICL